MGNPNNSLLLTLKEYVTEMSKAPTKQWGSLLTKPC